MTDLPVLYSFRRCPYAMRARLALAAAGIAVELREVVLKDKPQAMLDISPKGTVPVLQLSDGTVLEESLDIMLWAFKQFQPEQYLGDEATLQAMLQVIAFNDNDFIKAVHKYKYPEWSDMSAEDALAYRDQAMQTIQDYEQRLAQQQFLFCDHVMLIDLAVLPFVRQLSKVDEAWFRSTNHPKVFRWMDELMQSDLFKRVMQKYSQWQMGTQGVVFAA